MTISTHKAEVVKLVEAFPIEGADRILRVDVWGGFPCVVGKEDWEPGKLWIFIQPDSLVDVSRPEFKFLAKKANAAGLVRIRTIKLRGQQSMGLLIPAPAGAKEGQDYATKLGITHYEPPVKGDSYTKPRSKVQKWVGIITHRSFKFGEKPPNIHVPYYDVDALRRFRYAYEGHEVVVTEKIHGSNVAYCWANRGFWYKVFNRNKEQNLRVRSRTVWQKIDKPSWYVDAVTDEIKNFLNLANIFNLDYVLFGEVYGPGVQSGFDYGLKDKAFIAFDLWNSKEERWEDHNDFAHSMEVHNIPRVPELYRGTFDFDHIVSLAEGPTTIGGGHVREGVVISVVDQSLNVPRQLKCVGISFYEHFE